MTEITLNAPKLFDLSGRTALVTGAGSGIGQRIALGLAQCGADVACLDRRTDAGLTDTVGMIEGTGRRAVAITADVTDRSALGEAVAKTEGDLGALGIAVNAAGIANANSAEEMDEEQYQTLMDINMKGVWLSCRAEARAMLAHGKGGSIVNIASMSGVIVNRGLSQVHYNASKAGVIHMSKSMAMEWVDRGIRVNSISPGGFERGQPQAFIDAYSDATPLGRMGRDGVDLKGAALFLASPASDYVTGHNLVVDGGFVEWK